MPVILSDGVTNMSITQMWRKFETWCKYHPLVVHAYLRRKAEKHARVGEPELRLLPFLVKPDAVAIDVGANKGIYTLVLSGLASEVIAFEPNPIMYERLAKGLPQNVTLHHIGLSDKQGEAELSVPKRPGGRLSHVGGSLRDDRSDGDVENFVVKTERLDAMGISNVGFIKIDVEGFEQPVIEGARGIIERDRPVILIELEERHTGGNITEMVNRISAFGYSALFLHKGLLHSFDAFDPTRHHDPSLDGYVRDFVFLPQVVSTG